MISRKNHSTRTDSKNMTIPRVRHFHFIFMKIAFTGANGHMGFTTLKELLNIKEADVIRVLLLKKEKRNKLVTKLAKKANNRIEIMYGDVAEIEDLRKLCQGVDYLLNLAGVIPPLSDKKPKLSYRANELGVYNVVRYVKRILISN